MAASAVASAGLSYMGGKATNSANMAMNQGQMKYNWDVTQWEMANQREMFYDAQDFNERQAAMNRGFAEYMSNTSYQRARRDMMAAGLNPILAARQGGASTPNLGAASIGTPNASSHGAPGMIPMQNALGPAVSSAMQAASTVAGVQNLAAQTNQSQALTDVAKAEEARVRSQTALNSAQTVTEAERSGLVRAQTATEMIGPSLRTAQTAAASAAAGLAREQAVTEDDRRQQLAAEAFRAREAGNLARTDARQREIYGPPGNVSSTVGGVSQTVNSILESLGIGQRRY